MGEEPAMWSGANSIGAESVNSRGPARPGSIHLADLLNGSSHPASQPCTGRSQPQDAQNYRTRRGDRGDTHVVEFNHRHVVVEVSLETELQIVAGQQGHGNDRLLNILGIEDIRIVG